MRGCLKITLAQKWQNLLIDFLAKSWCHGQFINVLLSSVHSVSDCKVTELWFNASTKVIFGLATNSMYFKYVHFYRFWRKYIFHDFFLQKLEILPIVSKKGAQVGWQSAGHSTRNRGLNYFFNIIHTKCSCVIINLWNCMVLLKIRLVNLQAILNQGPY